jgi:glycosyltransferase involved in cell wall biosynthesis
MNNQKSLRISVVIPVYNEAGRIGACLESIAAQTVRPFEVVVVDNNSTDDTREVVSRYPFARLISAKRQGVVHARNRGFNNAGGEIIGRIDADTRLPCDWVQQVQRLFADEALAAVSGAVSYYDIPFSRLLSRVDLFCRRFTAARMGRQVFLQGANMALRASAWRLVRPRLCQRGNMHEDFDLAIHLSQLGFNVRFSESLQAAISARPLNDTLANFRAYSLLSPATYAQHREPAGRYMYPIALLGVIFHVPLRALYRGANGLSDSYQRVNPTTFVD